MSWLDFANVAAATALSVGLNSIWLGLLLSAVAAATMRCLPRSNATTRYTIWFAVLLLVPVMPLLFLLMPQAAIPAAAATAPTAAPLAVPVTAAWPIAVLIAWAALTALLLARVAWSIHHIHDLKRDARPIGKRDNIDILASSSVQVPMAAGFIHRAIIFPEWAVDQLSPEEFEQVLRHELAHLRRWDDWTQLVQSTAQAVLFFNPALYWIGRRLRIEREIACDDWVVTEPGMARPYAACLTHLHELTRRASAPRLAAGATSRSRWQISTRVEALLAANRNASPRFSAWGWLAAAALAGAAFFVTAEAPPLVGVQPLPVAAMPVAQWKAPAAPMISKTVVRAAVVRPRSLTGRIAQPAVTVAESTVQLASAPIEQNNDNQYVLVRAWRIQPQPQLLVITVVWFEPPVPPMILNGI